MHLRSQFPSSCPVPAHCATTQSAAISVRHQSGCALPTFPCRPDGIGALRGIHDDASVDVEREQLTEQPSRPIGHDRRAGVHDGVEYLKHFYRRDRASVAALQCFRTEAFRMGCAYSGRLGCGHTWRTMNVLHSPSIEWELATSSAPISGPTPTCGRGLRRGRAFLGSMPRAAHPDLQVLLGGIAISAGRQGPSFSAFSRLARGRLSIAASTLCPCLKRHETTRNHVRCVSVEV